MNRPITSTEIENVIKNLPKKNVQDLMASQLSSTKPSELILLLLKLFQKIAEQGILPISFYEAITLIPKPDKDTIKNKIAGQYYWLT